GQAHGAVEEAFAAQPCQVLGGAEVVAPAGAVAGGDDDRAGLGGRRGVGECADGAGAVFGGGEAFGVAGLVGVVLLAGLGGGRVAEGVDAAGVADGGRAEERLVRDEPADVFEPPAAEALILAAAGPPRGGGGDVHAGACGPVDGVGAPFQRGPGGVLAGAALFEAAVLGVGEVDVSVACGLDRLVQRPGFGEGVGVADDDDVVPAGLGAADDLVAAGGEAELLVPGVDLDQVGAGEEFAVAGDGEVVGLPAGGLGPPGDADEDSGHGSPFSSGRRRGGRRCARRGADRRGGPSRRR